jgi:hypothetical protein
MPHPVPTGPLAPIPRPSMRDHLRIIAMGVVAGGVFLLGSWIQVPVLGWILMLVGGFFLIVIIFLLGILIARPERRR